MYKMRSRGKAAHMRAAMAPRSSTPRATEPVVPRSTPSVEEAGVSQLLRRPGRGKLTSNLSSFGGPSRFMGSNLDGLAERQGLQVYGYAADSPSQRVSRGPGAW